MCGFFGVFSHGGAPLTEDTFEAVRKGTESIRHRGPDDSGFYADARAALGFQRLSILDLSVSGRQPMWNEEASLGIVFNGEIYNYLELREQLRALGHRFRSRSDTEVLLAAYERWGPECLARLNGMWAFLIYDRRRGSLFGSRDRFGIKPLYRYRQAAYSLFASEIKAILRSQLAEPEVNWQAAANYLVLNRFPGDGHTFYRHIEEIPPGSAFLIHPDGREEQWRYWNPDEPQDDVRDPIAEVRYLLEDAVRLRLRSDVPVGVCLSGGIDSTSIVCLMHQLEGNHRPAEANPIYAFAYQDPAFDETSYVRDTIARTGALLRVTASNPEGMWESFLKVLACHDEPVHSFSAVAGYKLFQLASENGIKVVLNGQGADEVFAGYMGYFRNYFISLLKNADFSSLLKEVRAYCEHHRQKFPHELVAIMALGLRHLSDSWPMAARIRQWKSKQGLVAEQMLWFRPELTHLADPEEHAFQGLADALQESVTRCNLPLYLRIEDRNSMAHSVEARLPFMDYRLVSFGLRLAEHLKIRDGWNKWILREAMKGIIPERVRRRRDKMGFPTSQSAWVKGPFRKRIWEILTETQGKRKNIYDSKRILAALERPERLTLQASNCLWRIAQFELWCDLVGLRS